MGQSSGSLTIKYLSRAERSSFVSHCSVSRENSYQTSALSLIN